MNYFGQCSTVAEVKVEYRRLAKLNHPDIGGDTATMQAINGQYHAKLESLNGQTSQGFDGKDHTYYYRQATEQAVMDKIMELIGLKLPGITIELIGTWVWVSGTKREDKVAQAKLKEAKCRWHGKRKLWYWRESGGKRKYSGVPMDKLRFAYGSTEYESAKENSVAA